MVLPLLATGLGTALVPAIVGFVGVVVGSVLTWIREAHRQRGKTIAAGRLVGAELADTARKVERLPPGPSARAALAAQLDTPSWEQERGDLALGLDAGE